MVMSALEAEIVRFVKDYARFHGFSPTIREIQAFLGFKSPASAQYRVKKLCERGIMTSQPRCPRSLVVS